MELKFFKDRTSAAVEGKSAKMERESKQLGKISAEAE